MIARAPTPITHKRCVRRGPDENKPSDPSSDESTETFDAPIDKLIDRAHIDSRRQGQDILLKLWIKLLATVLLGYALFSRGFAYVGIGKSIFIGEICLTLGIVWLVARAPWPAMLGSIEVFGIICLNIWGIVCTLPYVQQYGLDSFRDAMLWGYSLYALIVAGAIIANPRLIHRAITAYRRFGAVFLVCTPVCWIAFYLFRSHIPVWPGSDVPLLSVKCSDLMVHLAGILCFFGVGFAGRPQLWKIALLVISAGMAGSIARGGLLAFALSAVSATLLMGMKPVMLRFMATGLIVLSVAWAIGFQLPGEYEGRAVSVSQLATNIASSFTSSSDVGGLDSNKEWRLAWWRDICSYTFSGPYFWTGKGYGINLATADGFQVLEDDALRSPHNSHLTFLARSGVPGLCLWICVQGIWIVHIALSFVRAKQRGLHNWSGLFGFLGCYWMAFIINASFDPAFEGPMAGIWFWTVFGFGIGSMSVFRSSMQSAVRLDSPVVREDSFL